MKAAEGSSGRCHESSNESGDVVQHFISFVDSTKPKSRTARPFHRLMLSGAIVRFSKHESERRMEPTGAASNLLAQKRLGN